MKINKVKLADLDEFVSSDFYKDLNIKPISVRRSESYINNPHSSFDDIVLYYILDNNKIIAFRTILADKVLVDNIFLKFGWLSGNWIMPEYRGRGIAALIYKEIFSDWKGRLMFANYSPDGLRANKDNFNSIYTHNGIRAYFNFSLRKKFSHKKIIKPLLAIPDLFIKIGSRFLKFTYDQSLPEGYIFETLIYPDNECLEVAERNKEGFIFKRGRRELNWIFRYPWITENKEDYAPDYPFSSYSAEFYYRTIKILKNGQFSGFFIFSVRDGHLKTLHINVYEEYYKIVSKWLKNYAVNNNLSMITIYNAQLASTFRSKIYPFLKIKNYKTNIYSNFEVPQINSLKVQDGDGDYIFT